MTTYESKSEHEEGVKSFVTIVLIDNNGAITFNHRKTITTGRADNQVTKIVADRTWRRAALTYVRECQARNHQETVT
mgnify:CR=1 FL=1